MSRGETFRPVMKVPLGGPKRPVARWPAAGCADRAQGFPRRTQDAQAATAVGFEPDLACGRPCDFARLCS